MNSLLFDQCVVALARLKDDVRAYPGTHHQLGEEFTVRLARLAATIQTSVEGSPAERLLADRSASFIQQVADLGVHRSTLCRQFATAYEACRLVCGDTSMAFDRDSHTPSEPGVRRLVRSLAADTEAVSDAESRQRAVGVAMMEFWDCYQDANVGLDEWRLPEVVQGLRTLRGLYRRTLAADVEVWKGGLAEPAGDSRGEDDVVGTAPLPDPSTYIGADERVPLAAEVEGPSAEVEGSSDSPAAAAPPEGWAEANEVDHLLHTLARWLAWADARHLRATALILRYADADRRASTGPVDHWKTPPAGCVSDALDAILAAAGELRAHLTADTPVASPPGAAGTGRNDEDRSFHHEPLVGTITSIMRALQQSGYCRTANRKHFAILRENGWIKVEGSGKSWAVRLPTKVAYLKAKAALDNTLAPPPAAGQ